MIPVFVFVVVVVEDHGKINFFLNHPVAKGGGSHPILKS